MEMVFLDSSANKKELPTHLNVDTWKLSLMPSHQRERRVVPLLLV